MFRFFLKEEKLQFRDFLNLFSCPYREDLLATNPFLTAPLKSLLALGLKNLVAKASKRILPKSFLRTFFPVSNPLFSHWSSNCMKSESIEKGGRFFCFLAFACSISIHGLHWRSRQPFFPPNESEGHKGRTQRSTDGKKRKETENQRSLIRPLAGGKKVHGFLEFFLPQRRKRFFHSEREETIKVSGFRFVGSAMESRCFQNFFWVGAFWTWKLSLYAET